jgi:hypothetical protein
VIKPQKSEFTSRTKIDRDHFTPEVLEYFGTTDHLLHGLFLVDHPNIERNILGILNGETYLTFTTP